MPVRVIHRSERPHYVVGLMSGTSADGIDAVVAKIAGTGQRIRVQLVAHRHRPFPRFLRTRILHASLHGTVSEICELNFLLGEHFGRAALGAIRHAGLTQHDIAAIGSHGQTVHHLPHAKTPSTLQIGEPAVIAERTGITTIADFRVGDMAAGGEGAPLVPYVDWALYTHDIHPRILQNLGGIGNLTYLPPRASLAEVIAFDTGPGNMVIDAVAAQLSSGRITYDRGGRWAARGVVSQKLLAELMRHPFLSRRPPKTTGREEFGERFVLKFLNSARRFKLPAADVIATATAFTAASIADAYERFVFKKLEASARARLEIILGGGGAKNPTLRKMLADRVAPSRVLTQDDLGYSNAAKEALAFAVLAHETLQGQPSNVPAATGARHPVVLGKIVAAR
ncbi:MAG TPA: anhydro-N-acetylmuramic acid kinase [Verrucomicrobiae bacterium]|nr:anhydro-N-acetylmuramic acid kinase [Verrucomicrobiae bacterium]